LELNSTTALPYMTLDGKTSTESCGIEIKGKYKWKIMFQNKVMFIFDTDFHMLMEYEQLCKNVFDMDKQIRFVAVYNSNIEKITGGMRKGIVYPSNNPLSGVIPESNYEIG